MGITMAYPFYNLYNGSIHTLRFCAVLNSYIPLRLQDNGSLTLEYTLPNGTRTETAIFMYNMVATMYRIKSGFSIAVLVYVSGFTKRSRIFKERT